VTARPDIDPDGYQYGFIADGSPVIVYVFGFIPFHTAEEARHTGEKCYMEELTIMRRVAGGEWEEVPE
jgi:hypothetical protein